MRFSTRILYRSRSYSYLLGKPCGAPCNISNTTHSCASGKEQYCHITDWNRLRKGTKNLMILMNLIRLSCLTSTQLNVLHRASARSTLVLIWVHAFGRWKLGLTGYFSLVCNSKTGRIAYLWNIRTKLTCALVSLL